MAITNYYFISILLILLTNFPTFAKELLLNCTSSDIICVPASKYDIRSIKFTAISTKQCNICVGFACMISQEKVITGIGCSDDFEKYCPNAPFNIETTKSKITTGYNVLFYHGYRALTCNAYNKCIDILFNFEKGNSNISKNGLVERKGADSCAPIISAPISNSAKHVSNNQNNGGGLMNNGFKFIVITVIGFVLVKFW